MLSCVFVIVNDCRAACADTVKEDGATCTRFRVPFRVRSYCSIGMYVHSIPITPDYSRLSRDYLRLSPFFSCFLRFSKIYRFVTFYTTNPYKPHNCAVYRQCSVTFYTVHSIHQHHGRTNKPTGSGKRDNVGWCNCIMCDSTVNTIMPPLIHRRLTLAR